MSNNARVLLLVKQRLNRLVGIDRLDDYLTERIESAREDLKEQGIGLTEGHSDTMLLVDYTVWQYQNRDKDMDMPRWLQRRLRQKWLKGGEANAAG